MTSDSSNPSLVRPVALSLLGLALLACGAYLSVRGYPDPAHMARLRETVPALWASGGFVAGLALLSLAPVLLAPSLLVLRVRLHRRRSVREPRGSHEGRGAATHAPPRPSEEDEFEPYPGEEAYPYADRPDDDPYGDGREEVEHAYARGYDRGRRPGQDRRRFDPRQRAGAAR